VSRFASLYSTGRVKFSISYPDSPSALALPLATGRSLRGEDSTLSSFEIQPYPALRDFQVQPRSLAMFRAEEMMSLNPGTVALSPPGDEPRSIVNSLGLDLKDVWVVEVGTEKDSRNGVYLGSIPNGAKIPIGTLEKLDQKAWTKTSSEKLNPQPFLNLILDRSVTTRPEEVGELRLIAWADKPVAGQVIEPAVDRHRGFTLVVAHLEASPILSPDAARYDARAAGGDTIPDAEKIQKFYPNSSPTRTPRGRGRR
jgi:hypothetical protein